MTENSQVPQVPFLRLDAAQRFAQRLGMRGRLEVIIQKADGTRELRVKDNLIVDAGFDFISDVIGKAAQPAEMGWIEVGIGVVAPAAGDTALGTTTLRKTAAYSHTPGTKVFQFETTFNAGEATAALTEAGVFNAASTGIMLDRVTFSVINKGADDIVTVRFTFTMS